MEACHGLQYSSFKLLFLATLNMFNNLDYHKIKLMTTCFTCELQKTRLGTFFRSISLNFSILEDNESSGFEAANDFDFLAPKNQHLHNTFTQTRCEI